MKTDAFGKATFLQQNHFSKAESNTNVWQLTTSGVYYAKSPYECFFQGVILFSPWECIWTPNKCHF